MVNPEIDFIAHRPDGSIVLLAEAKNRRGTSETWAAQLRRNMRSHGVLPNSQFFLIATPDRIYGWREQDLPPNDVPPQFLLDARKLLHPYFQRLRQKPEEISPSAFELLVLAWLTDIARLPAEHVETDPALAPLVESGLLALLNEAQVEMNGSR